MAPRRKEDYTEMHEVSRKKILMAAFELFGKYGYTQTSVDSIAKKAKISKGLIYHYFKSKQEILKGIFGYLMEEGEQMMEWSDQLPPEQFIEKVIDYSFDFVINRKKLNRLLIAITVQPEVVKGLKKEIDRAREVWMGRLIDVFEALKFKQPEAEAYLLGAIFDGVGIGYLAMSPDYPMEKVRKLVKKRYGL